MIVFGKWLIWLGMLLIGSFSVYSLYVSLRVRPFTTEGIFTALATLGLLLLLAGTIMRQGRV